MLDHKKVSKHWISIAARIVLLTAIVVTPVSGVFAQEGTRLFMPQIGTDNTGNDLQPVDSPPQEADRSHNQVQLAPPEMPGSATQTQPLIAPPDPNWSGIGDAALVSAAALPANASVDMKLLVIAADGNETDYPAVVAFLKQIGVPFDTMLAATTPLTASKLSNGTNHGNYYGIILVTGNLTYFDAATNSWPSAFDQSEWDILWAYESTWGVRQVTSYTVPGFFPDTFGLTYDGYVDTTTTPLTTTLTAAGQQVYPYLNPSSPVVFKNAWVYLGKPVSTTVTTPLLVTPSGQAIASINKYPSGRQNLAITAANNPNLIHSLLLSYGTINWVTKGLFLGQRRSVMGPQVDDLFIDTDMWDTTALTDTTGLLFRIAATDYQAAINWQNLMHTNNPLASAVKFEWAFNAEGTTDVWDYVDTLTPAIKLNPLPFNYVNHTYTHANLDAITYAQASQELTLNDRAATSLKLTNYFRDSMVQPDISGLANSEFARAAQRFGIKYMISDTSRTGWNNPTPNAGFYNAFQPSILIIPRRPSNLFYNLSTPAEWVSEYNCYYGPTGPCLGGKWRYWDHNLTYAEILDKESDVWLTYLLKWDIDPLMFHQANVRAYDGAHSLLGDLFDATLAKYNKLVNLPILGLSEHQIGIAMTERMNYNASGIKASMVPCKTITLSTTKNAVIPVTGLATGTRQEIYGGQTTSFLQINSNRAVTIAAPACK